MKFTLNTAEKDSRPIFITGNFNKWNPKDHHFQLTILDENTYSIDIEDQLLGDDIEYKFTKGGWENVELDQYGNITPNRKVKKDLPQPMIL